MPNLATLTSKERKAISYYLRYKHWKRGTYREVLRLMQNAQITGVKTNGSMVWTAENGKRFMTEFSGLTLFNRKG